MALLVSGRKLVREDPEVRGAGVEVEVQSLSTDGNGLDVLRVVLRGTGNNSAVIGLSSLGGSGIDDLRNLGADPGIFANSTGEGDGASQLGVGITFHLLMDSKGGLGAILSTLVGESSMR